MEDSLRLAEETARKGNEKELQKGNPGNTNSANNEKQLKE
jgi:hypothetical protein